MTQPAPAVPGLPAVAAGLRDSSDEQCKKRKKRQHPPTVTAVSPARGPLAGGTSVTITGTGFTDANGDLAVTAVRFGLTPVPPGGFTVQSDTSITDVSSPAATSRAPVHVTVTTQAGTSDTSNADQFTYNPPTVTAINPASGPPAGGTRVTITGSGFTGATAVNFGPNQVQPTVDSDTQITATSPAATLRGPVHVTVTTQAVTSDTSNADQFTYPRGVLFHQNMRVYGGGASRTGPDRNAAYRGAFATIQAHLVGPPVLIAGFTELTNNNTAAAALSAGPCQALGVGPAQAVCTRNTALQKTKSKDFTGIAVAPGVNILSWGRVVFTSDGRGITAENDVCPQPWPDNIQGWAVALPDNTALDYQSLVYVVADIGGGIVVAVAFLHNIFNINDNVSLALQKLPDAAGLIARNPAMPRDAGVLYICGDFNAAPPERDPGGRTRSKPEPFSQGSLSPGTSLSPGQAPPQWSPGAILTSAQVVRAFKEGGTTAAGNLYDYSFRSVIGNPPPLMEPPVAAIDVVTLDTDPGPLGSTDGKSDHAASLLII